ncbi:MAG: AEC family transporter [Proteobacteria bacterium]|nr:AEC family transporter [Pseudomonadota bacterium]
MLDILNLALPFFGLIFLGLAAGKIKRIDDSGLRWMNFFILYIALPALFYRILARTPLDELRQYGFIGATTLATYSAFALAFSFATIIRDGRLDESAIAGLAGGYGNIGYMGPGIALAALGEAAAAPVALIFCFDTLLLFSMVPLLMALAAPQRRKFGTVALGVARQILLHPLVIASALGIASAALRLELPVALDRSLRLLEAAAAPSALFTLGVTVALRRVDSLAWEVPLMVVIKLVLHPLLALLFLHLLGPFDAAWVNAAVLMASLPPALNVFVFARQYDVWVAQASSAVLVGTAASIVTLTTIMWLVRAGYVANLAN